MWKGIVTVPVGREPELAEGRQHTQQGENEGGHGRHIGQDRVLHTERPKLTV